MRAKRVTGESISYSSFKTPYSGIATMIFVQAVADLDALGDRESAQIGACKVSKYEILNFFRSKWAKRLADCLELESGAISDFLEKRFSNG